MANVKDFTKKKTLAANDAAVLVDQTTNEGSIIDLDNLTDSILNNITSKILVEVHTDVNLTGSAFSITPPSGYSTSNSIVFCQQIYTSASSTQALAMVQWSSYFRYVYFKKVDGTAWDGSVPLSFALLFVKLPETVSTLSMGRAELTAETEPSAELTAETKQETETV